VPVLFSVAGFSSFFLREDPYKPSTGRPRSPFRLGPARQLAIFGTISLSHLSRKAPRLHAHKSGWRHHCCARAAITGDGQPGIHRWSRAAQHHDT